MIDTHCHLTYDGLIDRLDAVLAGAQAAGVDRMISVGTSPEDARRAIALAEQHAKVFATVGVHPHYCLAWRDHVAVSAAIRLLAAHPKVVAIGEMGLDRHYPQPGIEDQKLAFAMQLDVVRAMAGATPQAAKPVIIHNREATEETVAMIRDSGIPGERFVFHCFTGTSQELDQILGLGAMVSFTGIVTFKTAKEIADCAARVPAERIMIETDSPYLTPEPNRKVRPNEPKYVVDVAKFLAARRGEEVEAFVQQCDANAVRFFGLP
jgi:TatD DNase family protein